MRVGIILSALLFDIVGADVMAVVGADVIVFVGEGEVGAVGGGQGVSNGRTSVTCKVGRSELPGTAPESRVPITVAAKPAV